METRLFLAARTPPTEIASRREWEADQIRAHQAGFSTRAWLETYPLTSTPHKERLLQLLASVGL